MQTIVATLLFPSGDARGPGHRGRALDRRPVRADRRGDQPARRPGAPALGQDPHAGRRDPVVPDRLVHRGRARRARRVHVVREPPAQHAPRGRETLAGSAVDDGIELGSMPSIDDEHAFFAEWLAAGDLFHHIDTFWAHRGEPNILFVHYDDMTADLEAEMRRVAVFLELDIDEELWPGMVDRCTFASMKSRQRRDRPVRQALRRAARMRSCTREPTAGGGTSSPRTSSSPTTAAWPRSSRRTRWRGSRAGPGPSPTLPRPPADAAGRT